MFKKLYQAIDAAKEAIAINIKTEIGYLRREQNSFNSHQAKCTIEAQRQTIELLTNALQDKYKNGLLVVNDKNNMDIPLVVKDGKVLTDGKIKSVSIYWEVGEAPSIEICQ